MMSFNLNLNYFLTPNTVTLCDISIYILEKTVQSMSGIALAGANNMLHSGETAHRWYGLL